MKIIFFKKKNNFFTIFSSATITKNIFSYFIKITKIFVCFLQYKLKDKLKKSLPSKYFMKQSDTKEQSIFLNRNLVVGIEKVILNQHFELRIGYLSEIVTGKLILEKIP